MEKHLYIERGSWVFQVKQAGQPVYGVRTESYKYIHESVTAIWPTQCFTTTNKGLS